MTNKKKMKNTMQICNAGRVSLLKRIKTNQRVKGVVQSGNNNAAIATHGDSTSNSDDEE